MRVGAVSTWQASAICLVALAQPLFAAPASAAEPAATEPTAPPPAAAEAAPRLEQKALDILKAASDTLAAAKTLSFNALVEEEAPALEFELPLLFGVTSSVALQRPDRLVVKTQGAGPPNEFFYDGKTMTAWVPQQNVVAVAPAPATIDAALEAAFKDAAIYFPFTDVIVADPYKDLVEGLKVAFYIGQSDVVGGTTTDMIAFGNDGVFVQAWIGSKDKLPRRLRAIYLDDPASLRHDMVLSDWRLNAPLDPKIFVAKDAAGAAKIPFENPAAMVPPVAAEAPRTSDSKGAAKEDQ
jgi:hypothetical protein